jgi:hypothetical protein
LDKSSTIIETAQTFIWNNARLLERHLFSFLFKNGDRQIVLAALRAYQNNDGGFGNALEPDKRTPTSQPIDQEFVLRVLDDVGFSNEIVGQIIEFLMTITTVDGGVPFVLPTVRDAPRAEWWNTEDQPSASINPTASIAGLLHRHHFQHLWLERATEFSWQKIETLQNASDNDLMCVVQFLENVPDRDRANKEFNRIGKQIIKQVALDPETSGYVQKPLAWAPNPTSLCRDLFDIPLINLHLQKLAAQQQPDGGWPISWPAISPASELEYRGIVTINAIKTLKAYGYIK